MNLTGALSNDQGLVESSQTLQLSAGSAQNRDGRLRALASSGRSDFQIGDLFDNDQGLVEIGNAAFGLASGSLSNLGGTVRHLGNQGFDLELANLGGAGGRFISNFDQIRIGLNVSYNRLEKALGRELPAGAEQAGGAALAEGALEALLLGGKSLKEAKALLGEEGFQAKVLAQLKAIEGISEEELREAGAALRVMERVDSAGEGQASGNLGLTTGLVLHLEDLVVNPGDPNALQKVLAHASSVQEYIDENPNQALAVGIVLAGLSGPKGIIQLAVEQALSQTEIGESLNSYLASLQAGLGKVLAESMEGAELEPEQYEGDQWLVGGGSLIASIVTGSVSGPGVKGKTEISVGAKGEVSGLLPKPGTTSVPASGVGAGATFKVESTKQLGKKLGRHVEDFGGNPANPADRKMVFDRIQDIGNNPEKVIPGSFSGQGAGGVIGSVFFRIKGNDVVVTKPDGSFVTILKDGVTGNTFVKNALKGQ